MKIRQRLRIMESNNQKDLKIKLFFLADGPVRLDST